MLRHKGSSSTSAVSAPVAIGCGLTKRADYSGETPAKRLPFRARRAFSKNGSGLVSAGLPAVLAAAGFLFAITGSSAQAQSPMGGEATSAAQARSGPESLEPESLKLESRVAPRRSPAIGGQPQTSVKPLTAFDKWREALWPDASARGISRATFDAAFKGVTPDMSLPDLVKPGETARPGRGQAEFSKTPEQYLNQRYLLRLARQGQALLVAHNATLRQVEARFGVPPIVVLAIWGRETSFGRFRLRHYAIRVLATQAFTGRRKDMFRNELLFALKMLEDRHATLGDMRSSWAGALGLTQTMPSEYYVHTVDMDGDGRRDIWRSIPDALGAAAKQLKGKGWIAGQSWGYEVHLPDAGAAAAGPVPSAAVDCAFEGPHQARTIGEWQDLGLRRTHGRSFSPSIRNVRAYLMSPAGAHGPAFLVTENFSVIKRYNMSDLYAVFVGHLADRIGGGGDFATPWAPIKQLRKVEIAEIQGRLKTAGYAIGVVDGLIGSNTRSQIGLYQRRNKLPVDCWPAKGVLQHMRGSAAAAANLPVE